MDPKQKRKRIMNVRSVVSLGARVGLALILTLALGGGIFEAAAQSFRGSIRGEVTDAHGLRVARAKATARNLGTSETREVTSDAEGEYRFVELPAGDYEVSAMASGFEEVRAARVRVEVGAETVVSLTLSHVKGHEELVEVVESVPLVETTSTTLEQIVDRTLLQELPLNGRDFGKLVALTPGVTVEGSGVAGSEKGFGQFNINGNRDRSNNYTLDGTDNNDPWFNNSALNQVGITGAPATLLPLDAIQEFNLQSQFTAEYGRNSGSVVNIVTRSGSNQFHGSLYEYNRNSAFDARNYFNTKLLPDGTANPQSHFNNNNFGGSLGGPIFKDHTFFFLAYEGQRERVGSDLVLLVPTQSEVTLAQQEAMANIGTLNPSLVKLLQDYLPTSSAGTLPTTINDRNDSDNFIVKVDHRINEVHSLVGRYAYGNDNQVYPLGGLGGFGNGSRIGAFSQKSPTRAQVGSASWLSVFSPTVINEVRFGYSRFRNQFGSLDDKIDPSTLYGIDFGTGKLGIPEIDFNGAIENLGATIFGIPRGRVSQTYQILDNFTWIRGRNTWKFGGEYRRALVDFSNDNFTRGYFSFDGTAPPEVTIPIPAGNDPTIVHALADYYIGNGFATASAGNTARNIATNGLSLFAEDEIRLRPHLTVTAGLRWEYFGPVSEAHNLMSNLLDSTGTLVMVGTPQLSGAYQRDLNNFGPRLGVAWNPRQKLTVRAAYGVYYDYIPMHLMQANFTNSAGIGANPVGPQAVIPLDFNQDVYNGTALGQVFTVPVGAPFQPSIFITDHNLRAPYVQSWSLNLQRQVGSNFAFEAGYVGSKGTKLVRLYDLNQNGINSNYSTIDVLSTGTSSTYHAGQFTARLQNWHRLSGFSTYTYAKSLDGASDGIDFNFATAALPQDSTNLRAEKGPSTFDTRHRWTTALNYRVPRWETLPRKLAEGWQLNTVFTLQSGRPIGVVTGGGINGHQRPDLVAGQPFVLPNWNPSTGYLNPNAFAYPTPPDTGFGNLGRNQIYGPGYKNVDFSLSKDFDVWEALKLQFRWELFNIFNHPNFALPNGFVTPGSSSAGEITATPDVQQGNPGLGGGGPRVMQLGLRLQF
jgi:outer membrane receptor protein involved in Fe transport